MCSSDLSSVNSFGDVFMSGSAASGNIEGFVYTSMNAFSQTAVNFIGQNAGAGKYDRIRKIYGICISVGYRVNSTRATQFRQWCTFILRQFAIRGYVIDKKRMENGAVLNIDYFEHLLAEIREIRLSERRFYQMERKMSCRTQKPYL